MPLARSHPPARFAETHDLLARLHPVQLPHALTLVYVPPPHSGESQRSTYVGSIATNIGQIANIGHGPRARPSREEFRICSRSGGDF